MKTKLIAPCGMNCAICSGYLRDKNVCPGCREMDNHPEYCKKCIIRNCQILKEKNMRFCSDRCDKYPCTRLKSLDKRYKAKYNMSMIDNLNYLMNNGIRKFIKSENKRWIKDGKIFCVHNKRYYDIK